MATVPPANGVGDWRSQLATDDRKKVIEKIAGVLRDLTTDPVSNEPTRLYSLASRFEETVYKQATSISEYFHMIASRMVNLKLKNKKPGAPVPQMPNGMGMSMPGQMMPNQGLQVVGNEINSLKQSVLGMSSESAGQVGNFQGMGQPNAGNPNAMMNNNMAVKQNMMQNQLQQQQKMMASQAAQQNLVMQGQMQGPGNNNISSPIQNIQTNINIQNMNINAYQNHPGSMNAMNMSPNLQGMQNMHGMQSMQQNMNMQGSSGQMMSSGLQQSLSSQNMNLGMGQSAGMIPVVGGDVNAERKYWEKHRSLQQYLKPLATMIDQIDRLLKDYSGGQQKNLQQIKKKLEYMYELLQETPQTRKANCSYDEGLKVLEAAERQIQHWLQQLSVKNPNQQQKPQGPIGVSPMQQSVSSGNVNAPSNLMASQVKMMSQQQQINMSQMAKLQQNPNMGLGNMPNQQAYNMMGNNPMQQASVQQMAMNQGNMNFNAAMMNMQQQTSNQMANSLMNSQQPTPPQYTTGMTPPQSGMPKPNHMLSANLMANNMLQNNALLNSHNNQLQSSGPQLKNEPGITVPHDEKVLAEPLMGNLSESVDLTGMSKEEDMKTPLNLLMSKVGRMDQDPKDLNMLLERMYKNQMNPNPLVESRQYMAAANVLNAENNMYWWSQNQAMAQQTQYGNYGGPPSMSADKFYNVIDTSQRVINGVEKHVTMDNQEVVKKRKLAGSASVSTTGNIMQEIKDEVMRYTQSDSYFKAGVQDEADPNTWIFESMTTGPTLYITFDADQNEQQNIEQYPVTLPIMLHGTSDKKERFPGYIDLAARKRIKEQQNYQNFLNIYKQYMERNGILGNEVEALERKKMKFLRKDTGDGKSVYFCTIETHPKMPSLRIVVPPNYPETSPQYIFDQNVELFLPGGKNKFEQKIRLVAQPYSLTSIADVWFSVVNDQNTGDSENVNVDDFLNSIWNND